MAVPEQIPVVNYVADGVVKKFDVPFEYNQQSDLHLYVDGVSPTIDKYFFADNAFNFYIAPTVGQDVKIKRITPKERDTDYDLHTNTVRPRALNSDFDRLWYVLQEVFSDVSGLPQAVQDEIIARIQGDESVSEDLKNYTDNMIALIIGDPSFSGINADKVDDASGETQQQVNYNGGSKWYSRVGGYQENERVVLTNGDIVKSTIDGNTNNPNSDMTGWVYSSLTPGNNLSDVADKAGARTNLDVYSKAETDSIAGTPIATESVAGIVKINNTLTSTSTDSALTAAQGKNLNDKMFGVDQGWKNITASTILNTEYTNTNPKTIFVTGVLNGDDQSVTLTVRNKNGDVFEIKCGTSPSSPGDVFHNVSAPIAPGESYKFSRSAGTLTIWMFS